MYPVFEELNVVAPEGKYPVIMSLNDIETDIFIVKTCVATCDELVELLSCECQSVIGSNRTGIYIADQNCFVVRQEDGRVSQNFIKINNISLHVIFDLLKRAKLRAEELNTSLDFDQFYADCD